MTPVQVLGCCGLLSSFMTMCGSIAGVFWPIAIGSGLMTFGNMYAMMKD